MRLFKVLMVLFFCLSMLNCPKKAGDADNQAFSDEELKFKGVVETTLQQQPMAADTNVRLVIVAASSAAAASDDVSNIKSVYIQKPTGLFIEAKSVQQVGGEFVADFKVLESSSVVNVIIVRQDDSTLNYNLPTALKAGEDTVVLPVEVDLDAAQGRAPAAFAYDESLITKKSDFTGAAAVDAMPDLLRIKVSIPSQEKPFPLTITPQDGSTALTLTPVMLPDGLTLEGNVVKGSLTQAGTQKLSILATTEDGRITSITLSLSSAQIEDSAVSGVENASEDTVEAGEVETDDGEEEPIEEEMGEDVAPSFSIVVSGLDDGKSIVLTVNGSDTTITSNGTTTVEGAQAGDAYSVSVKTQADYSHCIAENASGTVAASGATTASVTCKAAVYLYSTRGLHPGIIISRHAEFADSLCQMDAGTQGVPAGGRQLAFVSSSRISGRELKNLPSLQGFSADTVVISLNRTVVADDWADLWDGSIKVSLNSAGVTDRTYLTNTTSNGSLSETRCEMAPRGSIGNPDSTSSSWIEGGGDGYSDCWGPVKVLCLSHSP